MMEWQPIETAPNDGRLFLAFTDGEVIISRWSTYSNAWLDSDLGIVSRISHWMPLPEPPK